MNKEEYFNDLIVRLEELFYHELSDCARWKTELIGVDFIQSKEIKGNTSKEIIESCISEITEADLVKDINYSIGGKGILLKLRVSGCIHLPKEIKLKKRGIEPLSCPIANMILDQLIERLNYETTYMADIAFDENSGECNLKAAIYETPEHIGLVSDWSQE